MSVEKQENQGPNMVSDLNTTFEESLKVGFYGIAWSEYEGRKRLLCMTKDGQYSFYFAIENGKFEMLGNRKEVEETYTLDQIIDELQGFFSFKHDYLPIDDYKNCEFSGEDIENISKLESVMMGFMVKKTRGDIDNILD